MAISRDYIDICTEGEKKLHETKSEHLM